MSEQGLTSDKLTALRKAFPPESYGKLQKGGAQLDYVGHAAVTDRLLSVDPMWSWEPMAVTPEGLPAIRKGDKVWNLWIRLTVCGKTVLGVGTCLLGKEEPEKELIGDALRNAAMRLGVALDLWSKSELESAVAAGEDRRPPSGVDTRTGEVRGPQPTPPQAASKPATRTSPPPQAAQQASDDRSWQAVVDSVDVSRVPEPGMGEGTTILWGVAVPNMVLDGWGAWSKYPVTDQNDPKLTEAQRARIQKMRDRETDTGKSNPALHYTWGQMAEGSAGGDREKYLRFVVGKAATAARTYKDDHRAAVALYEMLRAREASGEPLSGDDNGVPF
jgi:hypothetical protein